LGFRRRPKRVGGPAAPIAPLRNVAGYYVIAEGGSDAAMPKDLGIFEEWSEWRDSNPRPLDPQSNSLS
jgi:hypothetical protein